MINLILLHLFQCLVRVSELAKLSQFRKTAGSTVLPAAQTAASLYSRAGGYLVVERYCKKLRGSQIVRTR